MNFCETTDSLLTAYRVQNIDKSNISDSLFIIYRFAGKTLTLDFACSILSSQTVTLTALSEIAAGAPLYIVKVISGNGTPFFLEYRTNTSGDATIDAKYRQKTGRNTQS